MKKWIAYVYATEKPDGEHVHTPAQQVVTQVYIQPGGHMLIPLPLESEPVKVQQMLVQAMFASEYSSLLYCCGFGSLIMVSRTGHWSEKCAHALDENGFVGSCP